MPKHRVSEFKRGQARELRRDSTNAERKLWRLLRSRQLESVKFRRQVPIGSWIVDFVAFESMIVVEADGGQHAEATRDNARDADLRARGFRVLRFWNNNILANPEGVLHVIVEALALSPSPASRLRRSAPSPTRGEGGAVP